MKKGNKRRFLPATVGLLMFMSLVLVACGGSQTTSSPTPTATPTPTPTPTSVVIVSPLIGDYTTTITKADIPKDSYVFPGHWTITFGTNRLFSVFHEGTSIDQTLYEVQQNQVTFIDDTACQGTGIPDAGTGTYTWMLKGKILTLKVVSDKCPDRKVVLSTHPWVKQG